MSDPTQLVERYIATWNEPDSARRRDLISEVWTPDGAYLDPRMAGEGVGGIDAMIAGFQEAYPGLSLRLSSPVDAHHDRIRFGWELAPEGGPALAGGVDFAIVAQGRLKTITGFFDFVPG